MTIEQTLQRTNWNKQEAAHILGLYRPTLYSKMRKHNIEDPGRANPDTVMPPFGRHRILEPAEIGRIVEYLHALP